jgi:hypothetical protein
VVTPDQELVLVFGALHLVALGCACLLFWMFLRSETVKPWEPEDEDEGGGGGGGSDPDDHDRDGDGDGPPEAWKPSDERAFWDYAARKGPREPVAG